MQEKMILDISMMNFKRKGERQMHGNYALSCTSRYVQLNESYGCLVRNLEQIPKEDLPRYKKALTKKRKEVANLALNYVFLFCMDYVESDGVNPENLEQPTIDFLQKKENYEGFVRSFLNKGWSEETYKSMDQIFRKFESEIYMPYFNQGVEVLIPS